MTPTIRRRNRLAVGGFTCLCAALFLPAVSPARAEPVGIENAYQAAVPPAAEAADRLARGIKKTLAERPPQAARGATQATMTLEEVRKRVPGRYLECFAKGKSSTLDRRDHRAIADLQDARILLLLAGNTREFQLTLVDFVPQPGGKAYMRFGGPDTRTGEIITLGARDIELAAGKTSKQGGILLSSTRDNVTLTLGGPAKCKIAAR